MEAGSGARLGRTPNRTRTIASFALAGLAGVLVFLGAILLYAREEIIDEDAFAKNAAEALQDDAVRGAVATELVVGLIEQGSPDLIAGRPLLETVVGTVLDTAPFRQVFRQAARESNRLLFVRDKSSVAFDLKDALEVIRFALQSSSPQLAESLPKSLDATLLKLQERDFARSSLDVADSVRTLGIIAPIAALLALVLSVVVATDRRIGVLRAALAVAAAGTTLAISYQILYDRTLAGVVGGDELTDEELQDAVGGILDAFTGGLFTWGLLLAFTGLVIAGAAAVADPVRGDPTERLRERVTRRPSTTWGLALRGIVAVVVGFVVALEPDLALRLIALLIGAWLVYFGSAELLSLLQPTGDGDGESHEAVRRRTFARTGIAGAVAAAVVIAAVIVITAGDQGSRAQSVPREGCNGSVELCDLRLGNVVFAGTHNSFSAADSRGWFIANQKHTIERQLQDGVRLFLIDTHWGVEDEQGRVRTDFHSEGRERNKVVGALPPEILAAAERLAGSVGIRSESGGEREVWLCHTVCELGATRFDDTLVEFREFLDANPGEVVILFIEPYVDPEEVEKAFDAAGLDEYVNELDRNAPLPTLGEIVRSGRRLIVFTEKDATPAVPWYLDGFSFIQDAPLGAKTVDQLSCDLNRGDADSPMLMLNHWADVFPPQRGANQAFHRKQEVIRRAHKCERERGLPVSLIATDHYDDGTFIEAVDTLNEERIEAQGKTVADGMKVLYGVNGEGMGHATRSEVVIDALLERHDVRVVAGGAAFKYLRDRLPRVDEIFGPSFALEEGEIQKWASVRQSLHDARHELPDTMRHWMSLVHEWRPDVVITDFEPLAGVYARTTRTPLIAIDNIHMLVRCHHDERIVGAQHSDFMLACGVTRAMVPGAISYIVTTFFDAPVAYDGTTLVPPILRPEIIAAESTRGEHLLVYSSGEEELLDNLRRSGQPCRVYGMRGDRAAEDVEDGNLAFRPHSNEGFVADLASARAVIAGGGFSLLSEAVYLGKPVLSVPLHGQFEQLMNARYLERSGYGLCATEVTPEVLDGFIGRIDEFDEALAGYEQEGNAIPVATVEAHAEAAVSAQPKELRRDRRRSRRRMK